MASSLSQNLLDDALSDDQNGDVGGRVILIEDCVETSGSFVLHHFIKRSLSSSDAVIFLSFSQPFSHYDRILRKMGCNLVIHGNNKRVFFFDMFKLELPDRHEGRSSEDMLLELYGKTQNAIEVCSADQSIQNVTIMIDDVSLIEVAANGSSNLVLDFLHYCYSLTAQFGYSLVILNHEDLYSHSDKAMLLLQMEYLADVLIKAEPLATGLAADVHGQLTVLNKVLRADGRNSRNKIRNFHFRIKDNTVEYFYPGSQT